MNRRSVPYTDGFAVFASLWGILPEVVVANFPTRRCFLANCALPMSILLVIVDERLLASDVLPMFVLRSQSGVSERAAD